MANVAGAQLGDKLYIRKSTDGNKLQISSTAREGTWVDLDKELPSGGQPGQHLEVTADGIKWTDPVASSVTIEDVTNNFSSTNVEGALQELKAAIGDVAVVSGVITMETDATTGNTVTLTKNFLSVDNECEFDVVRDTGVNVTNDPRLKRQWTNGNYVMTWAGGWPTGTWTLKPHGGVVATCTVGVSGHNNDPEAHPYLQSRIDELYSWTNPEAYTMVTTASTGSDVTLTMAELGISTAWEYDVVDSAGYLVSADGHLTSRWHNDTLTLSWLGGWPADTWTLKPRGVMVLGDAPGYVYGIVHDPSISPAANAWQRVVYSNGAIMAVDKFIELPAHNFKRCVMDDLGNRHINYYLDPLDSTKKSDGTPSDLTGGDGDVMVEIPIVYWRCETMADGKVLYLVSNKPFEGSEPHPYFFVGPGGNVARTQYVGAYQGTLCTPDGNRLPDLMNEQYSKTQTVVPDGLNTTYKLRSVAGAKCVAYIGLLAGNKLADNNGGGKIANALYYQFMILMMIIEGGSSNTQADISYGSQMGYYNKMLNARLSGRCNFGNGTGSIYPDEDRDWYMAWSRLVTTDGMAYVRYPLMDANGLFAWKQRNYDEYVYTDAEAVTAGATLYSDANGTVSTTTVKSFIVWAEKDRVVQFQYRGIENPYGEMFEGSMGMQSYRKYENGETIETGYWWTADTDKYLDGIQNDLAEPTWNHVIQPIPGPGIIAAWNPESFTPMSVEGGNADGLCDYWYTYTDRANTYGHFYGGNDNLNSGMSRQYGSFLMTSSGDVNCSTMSGFTRISC